MVLETIPQSFIVRRPTLKDAEAVTNLLRVCEIARYGKAETTLEAICVEMQAPGADLEQGCWLILTQSEQPVGFAMMEQREHAKYLTWGDVHPEYFGYGLGRFLLQQAEERARQQISLAPPGARISLQTSMASRNVAKQRLVEELGYTLVRRFLRMYIELNEAPVEPQWAQSISVQCFVPGMERAVYEADEEAFHDHWGHTPMPFSEWEHWALKREGFDPSLWFLAMDGQEIAGLALCQNEGENGGWVHVLGVRRAWRRRGIAQALLQHAFAEFYRRGIKDVYLGVDSQSLTGATRLYERAGMHVVRESYRYEKELRAGRELSTQELEEDAPSS